MGCQRHALAALSPEKTRCALYNRLGGPHGRSWRMGKISPPPGFDPWTVQAVASRYIGYAIPNHERYINVHLMCLYSSRHKSLRCNQRPLQSDSPPKSALLPSSIIDTHRFQIIRNTVWPPWFRLYSRTEQRKVTTHYSVSRIQYIIFQVIFQIDSFTY